MARSIECARVRCTLGEMSDALRDVWGEHHALPTAAVGSYAAAAPDGSLDGLRDECVQFEEREGRRPKVLSAKVGMDKLLQQEGRMARGEAQDTSPRLSKETARAASLQRPVNDGAHTPAERERSGSPSQP